MHESSYLRDVERHTEALQQQQRFVHVESQVVESDGSHIVAGAHPGEAREVRARPTDQHEMESGRRARHERVE